MSQVKEGKEKGGREGKAQGETREGRKEGAGKEGVGEGKSSGPLLQGDAEGQVQHYYFRTRQSCRGLRNG